MTLNIGGDKDDLFYRYKMPPIQSKIEGKGNGIKTVIPNMIDIAKALNRPAMYPCKYFGTELGAQTKHEPKNDRYIINGAHDASKLQELLGGFIHKYVLCAFCKNPETSLKLAEDDSIKRDCAACGKVSSVDMRHKLSNYMMNHPTASMAPNGKGGIKKGKKIKSGKSFGDEEPSDEATTAGAKLHEKFVEEAKLLGEAQSSNLGWAEDNLSPIDQPTDSQKKLKKSQSGSSIKKKTDNSMASSDGEVSPLDIFAEFALANRNATSDVFIAEIKRSNIEFKLAVHVLAQVLVRVESIPVDLQQHMPLFCQLTEDNESSMLMLLGGFERLLAQNEAYQKMPFILQQLYENDAVDEESIVNWGQKVSKRYTGSKRTSQLVHDAASPFLEWLKSAADEDE